MVAISARILFSLPPGPVTSRKSCPFCRTAAHVRTSRYMSDSVKESYLQCQNVHCSATFKTHESIFEVILTIRSPVVNEKPAPVPTASVAPRQVKGCYSSPFRH
ncbi:ogr/Delta-like zinc finger family protein [Salmonella enterica]|nr:ogr/Delta-like zinc finger family protein [Salmonella enterica]EJS1180098.1 ogr/Delta-like zinc finger family protein [Salmonella enterica]